MSTTSSIGSGKTYSSISSWHAAFATGGWIGQKYGETTESFNFTGASTSAVNYIRLEAAPGEGVAAITSAGPLRYDGTKGGAVKDNSNYGSVFFLNEDYVTLSGLQLAEQHSNGAWVVSNSILGASNCVIENCILEGSGAGGDATIRMRTGLVRNTLVVNRSSANNGVDLSYASPTFVNCTIVRTGTATGDGFKNLGASSAVVKNCAVFGFTNFATSGLTLTGSDYNASDKTIGTGTHNQASKTYSSQFANISDATRDFRAKSGADLLNNGVVDSTNVPSAKDIIGTSRPQGAAWDIGCWELVTSVAYTLTAGQGAFSFAGVAASLKLGRKTSAAVGSLPLTGKTVGLLYARKFPSAVGSFSFTGQAVGLQFGRNVASAVGSFAFAGQPAGLRSTRLLSLGTGSFPFTGQDAAFNKGRLVSAGSGAFGFAGQAVELAATRKFGAGQGAFSFTGQAVSLLKGKTLSVAQGAFAFGGQTAGLRYARSISATPGSLAFGGQIVGLHSGRRVAGAVGSFPFSGQVAGFLYSRSLSSSPAAFAFTGYQAALTATGIKRLASMTIDVSSGQATVGVSAGTAEIRISASP